MAVPAEIDGVALRAAYETGPSLKAVCAEFGIGETRLRSLARAGAWIRPAKQTRPQTFAPRRHSAKSEQLALVSDLYDMLGEQIRALSARQKRGETEGEARQIEQLIKCLKTIHELRGALGGPESGDDEKSGKRSDDEIRAALERRLDQLIADEGGALPGSGAADGGAGD